MAWPARRAWRRSAFALAIGVKLKERALPKVAIGPGEVRELPAVRPLWIEFAGEKQDRIGALRLGGRAMKEGADYQMPYVPVTDARVMLSEAARGRRLAVAEGGKIAAVPRVGDYVWTWWPRWRRLSPPRE